MLYRVLLFLLCVFMFAFPKGGFKVGEIPLTWGYLLLFIFTFFSSFSVISQHDNYYVKQIRRYVLLLCLPFQIYCVQILLLSSITVSVGFLLSFILSIVIMPFIFLFLLNKEIDTTRFERIFSPVFINCVRFVAIFGLVLFFLRILSGKTFEIPYLTVNIDDIGTLDTLKYNMRGSISKLVSTYNNGNLYGISLLILTPLYFERERFFLFKIILIISLVLTLSRTVWIGILLYTLLFFSSKITTAKGWAVLLLAAFSIIFFGPIILNLIGVNLNFLFDSGLGGRASQLTVFDNLSLFGDFNFVGMGEIVYASILQNFGFLGIFLFILYLFAPVLVFLMYKKRLTTYDNSKAYWGLLIYCIIAISDGAILLIPVMAFYWFMSSYIFRSYSFAGN